MEFCVGSRTYQVRIVRGWVMVKGQESASSHDRHKAEVRISDQVPAQRRRSVLFHELRHAWLAEFGQARDQEHDARQAASYAEEVNDQLEQQGGRVALAALAAEETGTGLVA
jgi:Zn-dependent peptidase ImmA (M78 family)